MVTASLDKSARVWSLSKRKSVAVLRGHRGWVFSAAVNSQYIATGSRDRTICLYANNADLALISVFDGLHGDWIQGDWISSLQFIGSDLILSGSYGSEEGGYLSFTAVSLNTRPIARVRLESGVAGTAVTPDGQIAWAGSFGVAGVFVPPLAVARAAKEHALATSGSVTSSSAVVEQKPPPPLQSALVNDQAGVVTAGEACRTLLNAERCSVSISE